jgi:hypothetical protein
MRFGSPPIRPGRFDEELAGDTQSPDLASYLRIEQRNLEASGQN